MRKLLFVGDAGCPSGFAQATHAILDTLKDHYDITVLAVNYRGDPPDHGLRPNYPYPLYCAAVDGDSLGVGRLIWMCDLVKPDIIVLQTDGWFVPLYMRRLRMKKSTGEYAFPEYAAIPVVAALAVDGQNFQGEWLKDVSFAIFWTQFALREARLGGYTGPAEVIPLGVDTDIYRPMDKQEAIEAQSRAMSSADRLQFIKDLSSRFIVGNVNRNQVRKRLDLTIRYFAHWIQSRNVDDATLFLHTAPTGDQGTNILELAKYYGILERLALCNPPLFYGKSVQEMRETYSCFDVCMSTTQGEGFGLTTMEAMACGVPCIVPDSSALGEWAKGGAALVPCSTVSMQLSPTTVIGAVPDEKPFIEALDLLYRDKQHRELVAGRGLQCALEPQFRWANIGQRWVEALERVSPTAQKGAIWQEVPA